MARAKRKRLRWDEKPGNWAPLGPTLPDVCPLCSDTPAFPDDMLAHLQRHAPALICQRCDGKEKGWRLDSDGATHFRPDISIFYCSNCGRYAPLEVAPQD
jgi:hypothetical protein